MTDWGTEQDAVLGGHGQKRDLAVELDILFDDHLATFRSVVRKEVKKERRRVVEAGIAVSVVEGPQLTE